MDSLALLLCVFVWRVWLLARQRRVLQSNPGSAYALAVVTHRVGAQVWQMGFALLIVLSAAPISRLESGRSPAVLLAALVGLGWLWELPAKTWKVFVTDAGHGFNRLTPSRFLREQSGRFVLFLLAAIPGAALTVWLDRAAAPRAWLAVWLCGWLGHLLLRWAQPRLVAPLFDRVEPLPDSPLRSTLEAFLHRRSLSGHRLFLLRSSARSAQANAQVSGGAIAPRIVLSDVLIEKLSPHEVEAVVAHELGHLQRGHLRAQALMLGGAWLLLIALISAVTAELPGTAARLAAGWALMPTAWALAQPFANAVYRRFEFEADETAAQTSSATAMASALRTLTRNNANAPKADAWYERVYHTHPATADRLARLDRSAA